MLAKVHDNRIEVCHCYQDLFQGRGENAQTLQFVEYPTDNCSYMRNAYARGVMRSFTILICLLLSACSMTVKPGDFFGLSHQEVSSASEGEFPPNLDQTFRAADRDWACSRYDATLICQELSRTGDRTSSEKFVVVENNLVLKVLSENEAMTYAAYLKREKESQQKAEKEEAARIATKRARETSVQTVTNEMKQRFEYIAKNKLESQLKVNGLKTKIPTFR